MQDSQKRSGDATEPVAEGTGSLGFKFNQVGREEGTTNALRPQIDPAARQRRALTIGLVIVFFVALMYINWVRTGRVNPFEAPKNNQPFAPPAPQMPS